MEEDYKHPKLKHSSNHSMEFDAYIESLQLAFEYQGEQHYSPMYWSGESFEKQMTRDTEKKIASKEVNDSQSPRVSFLRTTSH